MESYFGRKVAVDASMSIYQFLIAMQNRDGSTMLTNDSGEVTSHLQGLMNRTAKMLECGIKPAYVFDGKPPDLKRGTLDDRKCAIVPHRARACIPSFTLVIFLKNSVPFYLA